MSCGSEVAVSTSEELFQDRLGQRWSPTTVKVTWSAQKRQGLPAPVVTVKAIGIAKPHMTADELRRVHLTAALDVLDAARALISGQLSPNVKNHSAGGGRADRAKRMASEAVDRSKVGASEAATIRAKRKKRLTDLPTELAPSKNRRRPRAV
jgi:hypothetical protein